VRANGLRSCFRKAKVFDFALLYEVLHCSRDIFDGHFEVDAMLIEEIDGVDAEALERGFGDLLDVFGAAVQLVPFAVAVRICIPAKFRSDDNMSTERLECFSDEFFVGERSVDFGGIEEGDSPRYGCAKERNHLLFVFWRTIRPTHTHAAEANGGNFEIAVAQRAAPHFLDLASLEV